MSIISTMLYIFFVVFRTFLNNMGNGGFLAFWPILWFFSSKWGM